MGYGVDFCLCASVLDVKRCAEVVLSSWVVVYDTVLTFVCMLRYWMRNVVPRELQWNCNEVLDVRCTSAGFRSPCGIQQGAAIYAVIRPEFRNPCGIYGRDSAIYAAIRPGPPQPMRLLFPHTKFRKYLINKVFPK